ncbi:16S rRNA (cytosine(1402)-N(4))-methyltransferase [Candidatus Campbellbacteria bacterium CG22_combo_CG10-13_8_21_14_all_36_13]|uniref:16S rRNA (Cytosine(1402)-N(4))-methyltransferase n=1 Tax=Candidatus Campbellbacteria bacterium CG22_combo_CG10-13_8_21_14_all_36_13 TaxID=1974529 RepID=A0A2H0DY02_9BACT|nr:MAG: 16S rRNA (cytosine(1402)-N(4))-methyltransferase [Candidatus Campbellbacteria bacterium CG22_combo_CG10-13_8_21_14_all_36_13]
MVEAREIKPIETTFELIEIIKSAVPEMYKRKKIHPATKTFQALRITVNDEIESLREGLARGFNRVSSGGKIAVISFHSIEDRIVKRFFKEKGVRKEGRLINKKPVTPDEDEIEKNIASRSAKLRVIEKI